jgi:hypothetical protein
MLSKTKLTSLGTNLTSRSYYIKSTFTFNRENMYFPFQTGHNRHSYKVTRKREVFIICFDKFRLLPFDKTSSKHHHWGTTSLTNTLKTLSNEVINSI